MELAQVTIQFPGTFKIDCTQYSGVLLYLKRREYKNLKMGGTPSLLRSNFKYIVVASDFHKILHIDSNRCFLKTVA